MWLQGFELGTFGRAVGALNPLSQLSRLILKIWGSVGQEATGKSGAQTQSSFLSSKELLVYLGAQRGKGK